MRDPRRSNHGNGSALFAAIAGAAVMYLLDLTRGMKRRTGLGRRLARVARDIGGVLRTSAVAVTGARDTMYEQAAHFIWTDPEGEVVAARVRSEVARAVSHPDAIDVAASGGIVTLTGVVLRTEHDALIDALVRVPGVTAMENQLDVHDLPRASGQARHLA